MLLSFIIEIFCLCSLLHRIIADHSEEKKSLEGFDNNIDYIAHRLNWNKEDIEKALKKNRVLLQQTSSSKVGLGFPKFSFKQNS